MTSKRTLWTLLEESDLPDMIAMAAEADTFKYLRFLRTMTPEVYLQFLHGKLLQIREGKGYHWAVRLKTNGAFVGAVNLNAIRGTTRLQIGCQLKKEFWHQGFASECLQRVMEFAIAEIGLKEVYGVFEKENIVSRRLLEKLGFVWLESKKEGEEPEIEIHKYVP